MENIKTLEELKSFITYVKEKQQGYITNFYISNERINIFLQDECLFFIKYDNTVFVFMKINDYMKLYYFSTNYSTLSNDLLRLDSLNFNNTVLICDIMGKGELLEEKKILHKSGFKTYGSLIHFTKQMKNIDKPLKLPDNLKYATLDDFDEIISIIHSQFNKYIDINFMDEEIKQYIEKKQTIKILDDKGKLAGFFVFDFKGKKVYAIIAAVKKEYKNTFYSFSLFSYANEIYDRYKFCSLFVRNDNMYLLKYYRKLKFIEDGLKIHVLFKEYGKKIEEIIAMN